MINITNNIILYLKQIQTILNKEKIVKKLWKIPIIKMI